MEKVAYEGGVSVVLRTFANRSPYVCSTLALPLICWLGSSDVSVSALRAHLIVDALSGGTVAIIEELVISLSVNRISPTSTAAEEDPVVGLATLGFVSFSPGKIVTMLSLLGFVEVRAVVRRQEPVSVVYVYYFASPRQG